MLLVQPRQHIEQNPFPSLRLVPGQRVVGQHEVKFLPKLLGAFLVSQNSLLFVSNANQSGHQWRQISSTSAATVQQENQVSSINLQANQDNAEKTSSNPKNWVINSERS
jgi:hypothetical protein